MSLHDACCSNYMLDISGGLHEMGAVRWQLTLCLLLCWVIVFFSLAKGITVSGKVSVVSSCLRAYIPVVIHADYRVAQKNGATGHPISLQIFRKLHYRIA